MRYVFYALFKVPGAAESALQELATAGLPPDSYQIVIHNERPSDDLRASESDGRRGLLIGVAAGVGAGALLGWVLSEPLAILALPVGPAMGFGMFLGSICGALGGGIYGTGLVNRNLQRLSAAFRPGQTLITAEFDCMENRTIGERIFKKHGAIEASE